MEKKVPAFLVLFVKHLGFVCKTDVVQDCRERTTFDNI